MPSEFDGRRQRLLITIEDFIADRGYSPTVRELSVELGQTLNMTHRDLLALREEGLVEWNPTQPRTIRPTTSTSPTSSPSAPSTE